MDGLALLRRARDAGLRVEAAGDRLLIHGPKRSEAVVKLLAENKAEVLAALSPTVAEANRWRERYTARTFEWCAGKRTWREARRLAWGDLQNEWHARQGKRWPAWQCAGCETPIGGLDALDLPEGIRVHFEPIDCLVRFCKRWRAEADAALVSFGLEMPADGKAH